MARLVWIGVGAVGGVYAYRKGEHLVDTVRGQGVAGTVHLLAATTLQAVGSVRSRQPDATPAPSHADAVVAPAAQTGLRVGRFRISRADEPSHALAVGPTAIMDTGVIDITAAGRPNADTAPRRKAR